MLRKKVPLVISGYTCPIIYMNGRTLIFLLVASLLLVGLAHAASQLAVDSGTADGSYLQVKASGIASATSLQFDLRYDPAIVSLQSIRKAEGYQSVSMTTNTTTPGTARVLVIFPDPVTIDTATGVVEVSFTSAASGAVVLSLEDARWSDFPAFASIPFESVAGGSVSSTIASIGTGKSGESSGSDEVSSSAATPSVTATATAEPTWDAGFLSTQEETGEVPTLSPTTSAPIELGTLSATVSTPAVPDSTSAPAPLLFVPVLIMILFRRAFKN